MSISSSPKKNKAMKRSQILLLAAFACGRALAADECALYFPYAVVQAGQSADLELCLRNSATNLTCIEAEVKLPEGINVECDAEGNPLVKLIGNRAAAHELLANILPDGNLKLLVSSADNSTISGKQGPILNISVRAAETTPSGEYALETVGESLLVDIRADAYYSVGNSGTLLVADEPTDIRATGGETAGEVYDLAGRKMADSKKAHGINIVRQNERPAVKVLKK